MHQSQWQSVSCCVSSVLYEWTGVDRCAACIQLRAEAQVWASKSCFLFCLFCFLTFFAQNNDQIEALKKTVRFNQILFIQLVSFKNEPKIKLVR